MELMQIRNIFQNKLFKSSLVYVLTESINKAVPFLFLPILSYYLLPREYGIVANFGVLSSVLLIFVAVGVDSAISINYYKLKIKELSKYIFNCIFIVVITSITSFVVVLLFNEQIHSFTKIPLKYQLAAVLVAAASVLTNINLALWRLEEKPFKFGGYTLIKTVVVVLLTLLLVIIYKLGWVGRLNALILTNLFFGLSSLYILFRSYRFIIDVDGQILKKIAFFGFPLIPHALSFWIRSGVDRILITKIINETVTGLYSTAFIFGTLITFITSSFNNAFVPYAYKNLSVTDEVELKNNKRNLVKIVYFGMIILLCLCVLFTYISRFLLFTFFDSSYSEASPYIFWAILSQTFQGMYLFFVNYIIFAKQTKKLALITFCCSLLHVLLSYTLIGFYGALGAAYTAAIVSFINFTIVAFVSYKVFKMPWLEVLKLR